MPEISPAAVVIVAAAGSIAGCLGALLGIGGGVFLVPFLHLVVGLDLGAARGIGLITVIGTSSVVGTGQSARPFVNLRLGMLLQVPASAGALIAALMVSRIPDRVLYILFSIVTAGIAAIMVASREHRNTLAAGTVDPGPFGGAYYEEETGREAVYRTKRLPLAAAVSVAAGYVSGSLGIGGGILQVPAVNAWCGVPLRAAAATSAVVIGITAMASAPIFYARGDVLPAPAAAAVLGVFAGSRVGLYLAARARSKWLKLLMAAVLVAVSLSFVFKAI